MPSAAAATAGGADSNYKWKVLSTVIFGLFMVILDTTVVNVAFQTLRQDFGGAAPCQTDDGFSGRYQYGSNSNERYSILGAILGGILNLRWIN